MSSILNVSHNFRKYSLNEEHPTVVVFKQFEKFSAFQVIWKVFSLAQPWINSQFQLELVFMHFFLNNPREEGCFSKSPPRNSVHCLFHLCSGFGMFRCIADWPKHSEVFDSNGGFDSLISWVLKVSWFGPGKKPPSCESNMDKWSALKVTRTRALTTNHRLISMLQIFLKRSPSWTFGCSSPVTVRYCPFVS